MTPEQAYEFSLLLLCIYRESSGQSSIAQHGVGWVIRNRVNHPSWMGTTYSEVILKPKQFSSFNGLDKNGHIDLNNLRFPIPATDPGFGPCLLAAKHVYEGSSPDPTKGALWYFDDSMAANPPSWSKALILTAKLDRLNFFREP